MSTPETTLGTPSSPEHSSVPPLEKALRFDAIDGLWQKTKDVYYAHHAKDAATERWAVDDEDAYNTEVIDAIHTYLTGKGLDEGSDESSYDFAKLGSRLRDLSFDRMFTRRWKYGDWQKKPDGGFVLDAHGKKVLRPGTSGESRVRKLQLAFTGRDLEEEARESASAVVTTPETDRSGERLAELQTAKYEAFVNRMKGPAFGRKKRENQQKYEEAELAYMVALGTTNKRAIAEKRDELAAVGMTDDEIADELKLFAKREAERINKEDQEAQHRLLVEKSGSMGRFLEWYGKRSTLGKIALGAGLSGVAIASGFGIGLLAGAFGGLIGAGVATGAGVGVTRVWGATRTYQLRLAELYRYPTHFEEFEVEDEDGVDDLHLRQRKFLEDTSREQIKKGEKVKRHAVYWALGTTALGGATGALGHAMADGSFAHLPGAQIQHWIEGRSAGVNGETPRLGVSDIETKKGPGWGDFRHDAESPPNTSPVENGVNPTQTYIEQHAAAKAISKGEGWYQTFKELGVKPEDYHKLLQEVGDDLHKQGVAYWDQAHGEWRMNMTPDGKMPDSVLKTIVEHAQADGYLKNPLDFGAEVTPVASVTGVDHSVHLWHGAPTESVLQETYGTYGGTLSNSQAYEAINAMYRNPDIGSHGVFDGATLSTPSSGDIWIDQDHGSVSLTPKAKEFLDNFMTSQPKVGEVLASVDTLAISDFHPETMDQLLDKLNSAHVVDVPKEQYGQAAKQMGSMLFRNDLAFYDRYSHTWELNSVDWSKRNVVDVVAYLRDHFTLAA